MATDYFMFEDRTEPLSEYQREAREKSVKLAEDLANFANSLSRNPEDFLLVLSRQHRTLQQSVTRLFMQWLEYIARPEFRTDARNEAAQLLARDLVKAMQEKHGVQMDNILSGSLPTI